jgi:hypothetical protein
LLYIDKKGDDVLRRFCVLAALAAAVCAAFAPISRATAATAVLCRGSQAVPAYRSLSSANSSKLHHYCAKAKTLSVKVQIIKRHRLWIAPRYKYWWHVPDKKWRKTVFQKRLQVRNLQRDLAWLSGRIKKLTRPVDNRYLPYQHFNSCLDAVKYLFQGRSDLERAKYVVKRESTYSPNAANGSHLGCAQESDRMRATHLKGPWNDAYWNVLVLLEVVEDGGWCNWDIVNYCAPGGEF